MTDELRCRRCDRPSRVMLHHDGEASPRRYCLHHGRLAYRDVFGHDGLVDALRFGASFAAPGRPSPALAATTAD